MQGKLSACIRYETENSLAVKAVAGQFSLAFMLDECKRRCHDGTASILGLPSDQEIITCLVKDILRDKYRPRADQYVPHYIMGVVKLTGLKAKTGYSEDELL